jgi:transposase InsO family protein
MINFELTSKNWPYIISEPIKLLDKYERWRKVAKILKLSKTAKLRLEWIIYYHQGHKASDTARHYGIARKTFYKWFSEFETENLYSLHRLEDKSKAPKHVRQRGTTPLQEQRIIKLRKEKLYYSDDKLAVIYQNTYGEKISAWKIQKVIELYHLYSNPKKTAKLNRKRQASLKKKRLTEINKIVWYKKTAGYIICVDTVEIIWNGLRRYIFTAIDKFGKMAFARMYKSKSSLNGEDFLYRLYYLTNGHIPRVGHDNGSEFKKNFMAACQQLAIEQYYSRVRTPKDNPDNERFNQTLQKEFINQGNFNPDPVVFNQRLTEWLVEYNFNRPHQSLNYKTPMQISKVLPMWSSCTLIAGEFKSVKRLILLK